MNTIKTNKGPGSGLNLLILLAALLISFCQSASAATYYVSPSGSDSNAGSSTQPFRTVAKGTGIAIAGDTVILKNGTYGNEGFISDGTGDTASTPVSIYKAGTSSAWITVKAENKWGAVLDCGTTSSSSLGCDAYFELGSGTAYWTFDGLVFTRGFYGGIHSNANAHHITVRDCKFEYIGNVNTSMQSGIAAFGGNTSSHDYLIDGNVFHDIGRIGGLPYLNHDHGLYMEAANVTIINNIFYNLNKGWSIQIANGAVNWLIANNTFAFPSAGDGSIMLWNTISNLTIRNNIFYNQSGYAMTRYTANLSGCTIDHNLVYGSSGVLADTSGCSASVNQVGLNPMLVNTSTAPYDFHAKPGGAGIDAGMNLAAVPVDFDGMSRPQGSSTDQGAFEYGYGASTPAPVISGVFTSAVLSNSAVVSWSTDQPSTSYVQYGPGSYTNTTPTDSTLVTSHNVTLSGLAASSLYHFRVGSTNSAGSTTLSTDYTLTTQVTLTVSPGVSNTQVISHIADGAKWKTTIILINLDSVPAPFTVNFWRDNGTAFPISLTGRGPLATVADTIPVGGSRTIETDGTASVLATGWAEVVSAQAIGGTAIFRDQNLGQEAAVPLLFNAGARLLLRSA